ncbi:amidohydrolase [Sphingomonas sp. BK235]|uniref:amidohydrolase n=1 Tax=Sphingomonas sp. BK235 TaxID=2512131 RepID=UPI001053CB5D|nr:amidohydrolase [Sphingomonas sp. BK235]TCP31015.1 hypothetical protein EV292_11120 [Sphingomonas sp. BK235]
MLIRRREVMAGGLMLAATGRAWAATAPLDVALVGGTVWTGDPRAPRTDAIGIVGDRIACIGAGAVRARTTAQTRVVRLDGAFVVPGFIDNHVHFLKGALALAQPDLLQARNRTEFAALIGKAARANPGQWITGQSWDEERMGGALPTRAWIDAVTPDTPVAVPRTDLHMLLLNTVALRAAGIDRNTPDPAGGVIVRDADGESTGILKDNAKDLVLRIIPRPTAAQDDAAMRQAIALGHAHGVAQVHIPEIDWRAHEALRRAPIARELGMRFYSMVPLPDWRRIADTVAQEGRGDEWVRWGGVKGLADGSLGSRTALFHAPYTDAPGTSGVRILSLDELRDYVRDADAAKLQVAVHAIGDLANDDVLDVFQHTVATNGRRDRRFRIEHAQHVRPAAIPRFRRQNVIASVQPYHAIDDGRWAVKRIGAARLAGTYAFGSLIRSGAHVTFGSDWPVAPLDPIAGIHGAVTRETIDGANPQGWLPDEKVTVDQALTAYTVANAYAGFQENDTGKVATGFLADLTVIDRDLTRIPADDIQHARIRATWVGGRERYAA